MYWYPRYVPVGLRRARALVKMRELREQGMKVQPVELRGRTIAGSFWGRRWCEHLESFSDYANRLPLGRTYLRNGSVCHLAIGAGRVEAMVAGQEIYRVVVRIRRLDRPAWEAIRTACAGRIGSVIELLQGRLPDRVMDVFAHRDTGLFPRPEDIELTCDCPDGAGACRHAAAVIYGVGSRLDDSPELLFHLRGVDEAELIAADMPPPSRQPVAKAVAGLQPPSRQAAAGNGAGPPTLARQPGADTVAGPRPAQQSASPAAGPKTLEKPPKAPAGRSSDADPPAAAPGAGDRRARDPQLPAKADPPAAPPDREAAASGFRPTAALIARLRERGGFSVAEFADLLQVSAATVRRWEAAPGPIGLHARSQEALTALRQVIENQQE